MASSLKNLSDYAPEAIPSAEGKSVALVVTDYHEHITRALEKGARETLEKHGVAESAIRVLKIPGAYELSSAAAWTLEWTDADAVICLGCVIRGETDHDRYINHSVANSLAELGMRSGKAVIFGLLTPNTEQQALDRAGGKHGNKGVEAAVAALRMMGLREHLLTAGRKKMGF